MSVDLRPIEAAEFPAYFRAASEVFGGDVRDADRENDRLVFEFERSLAGFDEGSIVSTTGLFSRQITIPGNVVPVAAVTMVTVSPTHRRQGVLTAMMRRQLKDIYEGGQESIAALWASEASIYGRFGYGLATNQANLSGQTSMVGLPAPGPGRVRRVEPEDARDVLPPIHESVRTGSVGWLDRPGKWWDTELYDPEHHRNGATALRFAVHETASGEATGYAVYRIKSGWNEEGPNSELVIREIVARDPEAYAGLWRFLLSIDLVRKFSLGRAGVDESIRHLVPNARAIALRVSDGLWVRLVDVARALTERRYATDLDLVLDIRDEFLPWNANRWRLSGGPTGATCTPSTDPAELELSSTDLGAAYLGGTSLASLAGAGRVRELHKGALTRASLAFGTDRAPFCPDGF